MAPAAGSARLDPTTAALVPRSTTASTAAFDSVAASASEVRESDSTSASTAVFDSVAATAAITVTVTVTGSVDGGAPRSGSRSASGA
jgi:hypothetical protein